MLSLALMVGAVINSLRFEFHDTGELPYRQGAPQKGCSGCEERKALTQAAAQPEQQPPELPQVKPGEAPGPQ